MKNEMWTSIENVKSSQYEVIEVLTGLKQICLVIKFSQNNHQSFGLFRPESTLMVSIDQSIKKPLELYLDHEFSNQCRLLGWNQFLPVYPWSLEDCEPGVIRPYWKDIQKLNVYDFNKEKLLSTNPLFWKTIAVADYIFGICDRVSNDFFLAEEEIHVVDSGFSFQSGLEIPLDNSITRKSLTGEPTFEPEIIEVLQNIPKNLNLANYLSEERKFWVIKRADEILKRKSIL